MASDRSELELKPRRKLRLDLPQHVYFIQCQTTGLVKIGRSQDPIKRLRNLSTSSPTPLKMISYGKALPNHERELHDQFAEHRSHGEWFHPAIELVEFAEAYTGSMHKVPEFPPPGVSEEDLIWEEEIADYFRMNYKTARNWIRSGEIRGWIYGVRGCTTRNEFDLYLESKTVEAQSP